MAGHASMMLDDKLVAAIRKADPRAKGVFTYLANTIRVNGREIPYSVVTATDDVQGDGIVLNEWAARDLKPAPGEPVTLEYYLWDPSGRLITKTATFPYAGTVPIEEWQRHLAPEYPGISDAPTISDWDPPFPMNLGRIRKVDEEYWDKYRATPKAFVSLKAGQNLWRSRYGAVTGMRTTATTEMIREQIDPLTVLQAQDVRTASLDASRGATDFGEYFLYFSFFLVLSALLLAGMFFRFGMEHRSGEIATFRAMGWPAQKVRQLLLMESLVVAAAGSVAGSLTAFVYSHAILLALKTWWVDAVGTRDLHIVFSPVSLAIGIAAGLLMALLVMWGGLRLISKRAPRESRLRPSHATLYAIVAAVGGLALLAVGGAGGFFGAGALLLTAVLLWVLGRLKRASGRVTCLKTLGFRYPAHRPGRAVLCIALIASATFLIVAVDSFRRTAGTGEPRYRYFAESAIPIYYDPNTAEGKEILGITADVKQWLPFRLRPGDDASCLNLYEPQNPRVIGAPASWIKLPAQADGTIPAAVDTNTLMYVLHRKPGDMITVGTARLKFVEVLHDTVFQSEIIIGDADFQRAFPEEQGFRVFLIDAAAGADAQLESALAGYGFDAVVTSDRIAAFHRVENTYLSTFQFLGSLGLLLGTAGLAAVVLRNILERRRELALLRASGYSTADLSTMIFAENAFLLVTGLITGVVCASIAVLPTVLHRGGSPPWAALTVLVTCVLFVGLGTSYIAVRAAVRAPILSGLHAE